MTEPRCTCCGPNRSGMDCQCGGAHCGRCLLHEPARSMLQVFADIAKERERQDKKHGGPEHDDRHELGEWLLMGWGIDKFMQDAVDDAGCAEISSTLNGFKEKTIDCEKNLICVAALAVAAIQSIRRKINAGNPS